MNINDQSLNLAYRGFQTVYNTSFNDTTSYRDKIAMVVQSTTSEENYAWLGQFPGLRKWLGDRVVKQLTAHGFRIRNEKYESTVTISREDFEDDRGSASTVRCSRKWEGWQSSIPTRCCSPCSPPASSRRAMTGNRSQRGVSSDRQGRRRRTGRLQHAVGCSACMVSTRHEPGHQADDLAGAGCL